MIRHVTSRPTTTGVAMAGRVELMGAKPVSCNNYIASKNTITWPEDSFVKMAVKMSLLHSKNSLLLSQ